MRSLLIILILISPILSYDYLANQDVKKFINYMIKEHKYSKSKLENIFKKTKFKKRVLSKYSVPKKAYKSDASWRVYENNLVVPLMFKRAKKFKKRHLKLLKKISKEYRVDINIIVAVAGVESNFGTNTGNFSIIDALTTLAFFKNRKEEFFKYELEEYLLLCRDKKYNPFKLKGSFAGAMGIVQQLPSINIEYGVDYNKDGVSNPWNIPDALASIANFLHSNGWSNSRSIVIKAKYNKSRFRVLDSGFDKYYNIQKLRDIGLTFNNFKQDNATLIVLNSKYIDEIWLGDKNFDILTSYNNSINYAMALYKISKKIDK
ncbi:Membrane-bound lytic murein transglycosylase B precursor [hydrothermal vent metagenome]|uniref:Membrane-bound lytic murein transglycosylase B n=1 Tax=hydrothermal vent metagenome TaxID=652676 RepID=A0A1W1EK84_9ZZZZ